MTGPQPEYTVAELREHLRDAIDATAIGPVLITRRGEPAAYLVSPADHQQLETRRSSFAQSLVDWREKAAANDGFLDPEVFEGLRDREYTGRTVDVS